MIDVRIETFKAIHVARIRGVGPVMDMGPCFERLFRWAASVGAETGRILTLSYDRPGRVAPGERRRDACVELHTHGLPAPGIAMGFVGAGRAGGLSGEERPARGHGIRVARPCADGRGLRRSAGAAPRPPAT